MILLAALLALSCTCVPALVLAWVAYLVGLLIEESQRPIRPSDWTFTEGHYRRGRWGKGYWRRR